jgi:hypothetical protein
MIRTLFMNWPPPRDELRRFRARVTLEALGHEEDLVDRAAAVLHVGVDGELRAEGGFVVQDQVDLDAGCRLGRAGEVVLPLPGRPVIQMAQPRPCGDADGGPPSLSASAAIFSAPDSTPAVVVSIVSCGSSARS